MKTIILYFCAIICALLYLIFPLEYFICFTVLVTLSFARGKKLIPAFGFGGIFSFVYFLIFWKEKIWVSALYAIAAMALVVLGSLFLGMISEATKKTV